MQPLNCPACGKHCLSIARKLLLSPAVSISCASCGARVSVPWFESMLLVFLAGIVPSLVGIFAISSVSNFSSAPVAVGTFVAIAAIVALPFLWAYYRFVPLVVRGA
jgi:membrane protein YdbS with pleckstrin-like domain